MFRQLISAGIITAGAGLAIVSLLILNDIAEFQEGFRNEEKAFYLDLDNTLQSGVSLGKIRNQEVDTEAISPLDELTADYRSKEYNALLMGRFKAFVFTEQAFADISMVVYDDSGKTISKSQAFSIIKSSQPIQLYASLTNKRVEDLMQDFSDDEMKAYVFSRLVFTLTDKKGPIAIAEEIQKETVIVHPETVAFKLIRFIPLSFIKPFSTEEQIAKVGDFHGTA